MATQPTPFQPLQWGFLLVFALAHCGLCIGGLEKWDESTVCNTTLFLNFTAVPCETSSFPVPGLLSPVTVVPAVNNPSNTGDLVEPRSFRLCVEPPSLNPPPPPPTTTIATTTLSWSAAKAPPLPAGGINMPANNPTTSSRVVHTDSFSQSLSSSETVYGATIQPPISSPIATSPPGTPSPASETVGVTSPPSTGEAVGISVSGGKDNTLMREQLMVRQLPRSSSFTSSGLFNEYFFDFADGQASTTEAQEARNIRCPEGSVFCPKYEHTCAPGKPTKDNFNTVHDTNDTHYLSIGLDSGLRQWTRSPLDVVLLVDTSGSMHGLGMQLLKLAVARILAEQLSEGDNVGVVEFGCSSAEVVPMAALTSSHANLINERVGRLIPSCGTPLYDGLKVAQNALTSFVKDPEDDRERRIIVFTDAMPNQGYCGVNDFAKLAQSMFLSELTIGMTFLGVGFDFNPTIMASIAQNIQSFTYRSMPTQAAVEEAVADFRFLVSPLAHSIALRVHSDDFDTDAVYGLPDGVRAQNAETFMDIPSFFSSPKTSQGAVRGGAILLRLVRKASEEHPSPVIVPQRDAYAIVSVVYQLPCGTPVKHESRVLLTTESCNRHSELPSAASTGLRKAVVLARYFDLVNAILVDAETPVMASEHNEDNVHWDATYNTPLQLAGRWAPALTRFQMWFDEATAALGDEELIEKENRMIRQLSDAIVPSHPGTEHETV